MILLRQSTNRSVLIGPFVDSTDGVSLETALAVSQATIRLSKNGANMIPRDSAGDATHDELGWYVCSLNTVDTGTLGVLNLAVNISGSLQVWHEYMVVTSNFWDTMFSTSSLSVNLNSVTTGAIMASAFTAAAVDSTVLGVSLADILADTNELQGDWTNAGRLDTIIDSILTDTGTSLVTMLTAQDVGIASLLAHQTLIEADTNELQGDWTNAGRLDTIIDSILQDTGTSLVTAISNVETDTQDIQSRLPAVMAGKGIPKNVAYSDIYFPMVDSTDHVTPETGLTVTVQRSIDGGAMGAVNASTATAEIGVLGVYQLDAAAADMNGDVILFKFTATGADAIYREIRTSS